MADERRSQWLRGVLDLCVLRMLSLRESYGYELVQALETAGLGQVRGGTLYPVLLRLQRAGMVTAWWHEGSGGPARKYYRITDAGMRELGVAATQWIAFAGQISATLGEAAAR